MKSAQEEKMRNTPSFYEGENREKRRRRREGA